MDILAHNSAAWDRQVEQGNIWTVPASPEAIAAARRGEWSVLLTETRPVPRNWFPDLAGGDVLCLASGGGQQGPILAAAFAGARVTVLDNSPRQLAMDRLVAEREGLALTTVQGDMADLSAFSGESFDFVFHPVSNVFIPDVRPVWREAFRVLRHGGVLLAGMVNPFEYVFDQSLVAKGIYQVKYALPYNDLTSLSEQERAGAFGADAPLEFSHTLEEQIGGQLAAGFHLVGFYEDYRRDDPIAKYMPSYMATRALKP
ncbi:MAG: class I SAM-dependent methyltransferase [Chloroflexi bacterium]|nr:class I SAM-dependent methyltransferase [Chloroflexota bacterium]MCL5273192.1 class I SAM-dependent methyltransferase [Chloroflexota bacterium]